RNLIGRHILHHELDKIGHLSIIGASGGFVRGDDDIDEQFDFFPFFVCEKGGGIEALVILNFLGSPAISRTTPDERFVFYFLGSRLTTSGQQKARCQRSGKQ